MAEQAGVEHFEVTIGLNDSPKFIDALAELVLEKIGQGTPARTSEAAA